MADCSDAQLGFGIVQVKRQGTARDAENAPDFPGRLAARGPAQALKLATGQLDTCNHTTSTQNSPRMQVDENRHQLQHRAIGLDGLLKRGSRFSANYRHRSNRVSRLVEWNYEPAANTELSRFVEKLALRQR